MATGRLLVCATPIGNLADVTLRVLDALRGCDLIAAEDTRQARKLLARYEISKPMASYHDRNERTRAPELLEKMEAGLIVALVSDAGTPGISDPGHRLINSCISKGIEIEVLPGPNAALTALVASGLPTNVFTVTGFSPRRSTARRHFFQRFIEAGHTFVFYESPHRVLGSLSDLSAVSPECRISLARELTKLFEEIVRGSPADVLARFGESEPKGEIVVVVSPPRQVPTHASDKELAGTVAGLEAEGVDHKEAMRRVARDFKTTRRTVYDAVLKSRGQGGG